MYNPNDIKQLEFLVDSLKKIRLQSQSIVDNFKNEKNKKIKSDNWLSKLLNK